MKQFNQGVSQRKKAWIQIVIPTHPEFSQMFLVSFLHHAYFMLFIIHVKSWFEVDTPNSIQLTSIDLSISNEWKWSHSTLSYIQLAVDEGTKSMNSTLDPIGLINWFNLSIA